MCKIVEEKVKKLDLAKYKEKFCRILVKKNNKKRKEYIALFSKNGFTTGLKKIAESECAKLYDLNAVKRILEVGQK